MKTHFYIDQDGYPRLTTEAAYEAVVHWLEGDVQNNAAYCSELLYLIGQADNGALAEWEGTGNSSTLIIKPNGARIENEYAIPTLACNVTLDQLKNLVEQWQGLCLGQQASLSDVA